MQPLRELDRWAAVLEKMGLLGDPFSGAEGNSRAMKSLLPWEKDRGGLWLILEVLHPPWLGAAKADMQLGLICVRGSLKRRRKPQWGTAT